MIVTGIHVVVGLQAFSLTVIVGVFHQLRKMNGRMVRQEQWSKDHEKSDEKLHGQHQKDIDNIWSRVNPR